ncbi:MAG: hypothetical protein ACJARZ_000422 [Dokdonia sp.]|jgi:hypothetical protein
MISVGVSTKIAIATLKLMVVSEIIPMSESKCSEEAFLIK